MFAGGFQKDLSADDVRVNEVPRIRNAAVDMRLGGKIDNRVELVLGEDGLHRLAIRNVALEELVAIGMLFRHTSQILGISCVAEDIHVRDELRLVVLEHEPHKIAPNKPTPARDQKTHRRHVSKDDVHRQCGRFKATARWRQHRGKGFAKMP